MRGWIKYAFVFTLAFTSGAILMVISHRVQSVQRDITRIDQEMAQEQDAIQILQAEWSFLNDPQRLEGLASQYLSLEVPESAQLVSHVEAVQPLIMEEDVSQGIDKALVQQVGFVHSAPEAVVKNHKPQKSEGVGR